MVFSEAVVLSQPLVPHINPVVEHHQRSYEVEKWTHGSLPAEDIFISVCLNKRHRISCCFLNSEILLPPPRDIINPCIPEVARDFVGRHNLLEVAIINTQHSTQRSVHMPHVMLGQVLSPPFVIGWTPFVIVIFQ